MRVAVTGGAGDIGARARGLLDGAVIHMLASSLVRESAAQPSGTAARRQRPASSAQRSRGIVFAHSWSGRLNIPAWVMGRI